LGLKTGSPGLVIWASKSSRRFLGLGLKTKWASIVDCATKPMDGGWRRTCIEMVLGMEASLARVSQPGLKTGEGATTGGARGTITEVASEAS
jgi:hypothetical protein